MSFKNFISLLLIFVISINIVNAIDLSKYEEYSDKSNIDYTINYDFNKHIKEFGWNCNFDKYIENYYIKSVYNKLDEYKKSAWNLPCIQWFRLNRWDSWLICSSNEITEVNNMSLDEQSWILEKYRNISLQIDLEKEKLLPFISKCKSEKYNYIENYIKNNKVIITKLQIIIEKEYKKSSKSIDWLLNILSDKEELIKNKDYDKFLLIQQLKRMCKQAISNNWKVQNIYNFLEDLEIEEYL